MNSTCFPGNPSEKYKQNNQEMGSLKKTVDDFIHRNQLHTQEAQESFTDPSWFTGGQFGRRWFSYQKRIARFDKL
jgi:hypothetical protein